MDNPAAVAGMVVLYLALLTKLLLSRRASAAGVRMLTFALVMLAGSMTVDLSVVYLPLDVALGSRNGACLLVYGQALASVWAFYMVLDRYLARSLHTAPNDGRRGYAELGGCLTAVLLLYATGPALVPDQPKLDAHPLTTTGTTAWFVAVLLAGSYFTVRAMLGAGRAASYAARTGRTATAVGLRLVALGGLLGLVNVHYQTFVFPLAGSGPVNRSLSDLATASGFLGAGSAATGVCLPAVSGAIRRAGRGRHWQQRRAYAALYPLWRDLTAIVPEVAMDRGRWGPRRAVAVRDVDYLLYRRVIELRDAVHALQPDMAPERAPKPPMQPAQSRKQRGQPPMAHLTAWVISSTQGGDRCPPQPDSVTSGRSGAGLQDEVEHFLALARTYRR